jgi:hypothetical protein
MMCQGSTSYLTNNSWDLNWFSAHPLPLSWLTLGLEVLVMYRVAVHHSFFCVSPLALVLERALTAQFAE